MASSGSGLLWTHSTDRGEARGAAAWVGAPPALDRLKTATREVGGVAVAVESYDFNALGALKVNAGVALAHQRPRLDGAGAADAAVAAALGGQPVTLDAGGRVTSLRGTTFTWSREGFLRQAQDPIPSAVETYGLDSALRRVAKLQGSTGEYYIYEGLDRVATLTPTGAVKEAYLFDGIDHPLRVKQGATTAYYEVDLAGNVRGLRASGGASLGGYRYSAFGQTLEDTSSLDQPLRWKGRWYSPLAGGLYDVRARQWSPELGSFLSIDEYAFHDPKSTLWGWPRQSPIRWRDPSGHDPGGGDALVFSQMDDENAPSMAQMQQWDQARGLGAALGIVTLLSPQLGFLIASGLAIESDKDLWKIPLIGGLPSGANSCPARDVAASTPVGRRGGPINVPRGTNAPTNIDGRTYTGHALDQMQGRGLTPSVVEDTLARGAASSSYDGATVYATEQARVVVNADGSIKTVIPQ